MAFPVAEQSWVPKGRSKLARELALLRPSLRRTLGVSDPIIVMLDLFVTACSILTDDSDDRSLDERFADLDELIKGDIVDWPAIEDDMQRLVTAGQEALPRWARNPASSNANLIRFVRRLLGPDHFYRLESAFKADLAIGVVAVRRGLRSGLQYATAMDRCVQALPANEIENVPGLELLAKCTFLRLAVEFDAALDKALALGLPMESTSVRSTEFGRLPGALDEISRQLSREISDESARSIQGLRDVFGRKLKGASDALTHSEDAVSQAANSLIELVDRLLRDAFDDSEVLVWLEKHFPTRIEEFTVERNRAKPTKRASALCFVYAGQAPIEPSILHDMAAQALVTVRQRLQALKHADCGSLEERKQILDSIATIESSVFLVFDLAWRGVDDDAIETVRRRLSQAVA